MFVAIEPPDAWLDALAATQRRLREAGLRLRYVRPEGIHLTLKFLGDTAPSRLPAIQAALTHASAQSHNVRLVLAGAGVFGSSRRPRVVWCGVGGDVDGLAGIQRVIDDALGDTGFPREPRVFSAHFTLARVPDRLDPAQVSRIAPLVATTKVAAPPFVVRSIALIHSELARGGARYSRLAQFMLGNRDGA